MRIAINTLPLKTAHKDRGIGFYTSNLLEALKKDSSLEIQEFTNPLDVKNADVIHYPWFDFFFRTLPKKNPAPVVVTIHDVIPLKFKEHYPVGFKGKINFYLQKIALKKCKAVITDSKISKSDIIELLKVDREKITVIPLAADKDFKILSDAELIRTKRKYNLTDQILLYVGDANWVKNLPFLIEAFKNLTLRPKYKNLKLVLVGGVFLKKVDNIDHPELEALKKVNQLIKEYGLENEGKKIIRVGNIEKDELIAIYNLATIYIQPSFYEGFGLPILEAMSCGVPVVSSKGGSLPEAGGEAAVYFDPYNIGQFESIIIEILDNRSLQDKLSRLGLKQVEKFSWDLVAAKTIEVYSNVIKF